MSESGDGIQNIMCPNGIGISEQMEPSMSFYPNGHGKHLAGHGRINTKRRNKGCFRKQNGNQVGVYISDV